MIGGRTVPMNTPKKFAKDQRRREVLDRKERLTGKAETVRQCSLVFGEPDKGEFRWDEQCKGLSKSTEELS